jgi:site-specific DNA recombinase
MGRTIIYCRVSTEEQALDQDSYSLPNQEMKCISYLSAKEKGKHGVQGVDIIKEVGSGKDLKGRPKFRSILKEVYKGDISKIVVYRLDRLSRSARDIYDFLEVITENKVEFVSVTENFDTTTPMGRAMLGVAAVFSQLTRETISENVKDGLNQRKRQGLVPTAAPYGYINYKNEQGIKTIKPGMKPRMIDGVKTFDKIEHSEVVKMIYDLYLNKNYGLQKIATVLNKSGIPTCNYPKTQMWNRQSVLCILDSSISPLPDSILIAWLRLQSSSAPCLYESTAHYLATFGLEPH